MEVIDRDKNTVKTFSCEPVLVKPGETATLKAAAEVENLHFWSWGYGYRGAKRAEQGHPEPFPLQYVEIGNENWGDEYDKRFDIFYTAIKAKYPELILISNHGLGGTGKIAKTDMIDPHWYVNPEFFFQNTTIFDNHPDLFRNTFYFTHQVKQNFVFFTVSSCIILCNESIKRQAEAVQ